MLLLALACLTARQGDQLLADNAELSQALADSQVALAQSEARLAECQATASQPTAAQEIEASALMVQANEAMTLGKAEQAKGMVAVVLSEYGNTQAARSAARMAQELEVVGKPATPLDSVEWWQGGYEPGAQVTLIVFWEQWCPHCRHEMPGLNLKWQRYKDQGLQVIGLTRVTKSSTDESAKAMLADQDIGFANGKEDGSVADYYGVSGIPAAVVIQDGIVIWRGHPNRIGEETLKTWLK